MEDGQLSDSDSDMTVAPSDRPLQVPVSVEGGRLVLGPARGARAAGSGGWRGGGSAPCEPWVGISLRAGTARVAASRRQACGGLFSAFHAPLFRVPHFSAARSSWRTDFAENVAPGDIDPKQPMELIFTLSA